ncbi:hypothetical protein JXD38_00590 [candidate division WOR-3 bacterium]|nr:hypothetical protein [candidate division WOR-3 bacterium]
MRKVLALAAVVGLLMVVGCDQGAKPSVTIVYPTNGSTIGFGGTIIKAVATDDKGVTEVKFFDGATSIGVDSTATADTFSVSWSGGAAGSHTLKAVATNEDGATAEHSISVTVSAGNATHHSGEIDTNEVWYPAGNPHIIDSDVYTGDNVTLTIMPGCYVQFSADVELYCGYSNPGSIIAVGTADSMITFTALSDTVPGFWDNIGFYSYATSTARMSYCKVEFGGKSSGSHGAIYVAGCNVKIDHTTVRKSGNYGICVESGGYFTEFSDNTIGSCAQYPVRIGADFARTLGTGNVLTSNTKDGVEIDGGPVSTTGTWLDQGVPYVADADVYVQDDATLTINPGTTISMDPNVEFYCGYSSPGSIIAVGTATEPITFTSLSDTVAGVWQALEFYSYTISTARLSYCVVERAGSGGGKGAVFVDDCRIKMDNCTVRQNALCGVYCEGATGYFDDFSNNTITTSGEYPVRIEADKVRTLGTGNVLTGNATDGILVHGGNVATTGTWLNHGVPYVAEGDVYVSDATNNPVLTIAAGTTVEMKPNTEFYVGYSSPGGLIAEGTVTDSITFTSSVNPPSAGDWSQVAFYSYSVDAQCRLAYCNIWYAGSDNRGNVYIDNSLPTVANCDIGYGSAYGIYLAGSEYPSAAQLRADNNIHDCASGDVREP